MGWFSDAFSNGDGHEGSLTHDLLAGAVAYEAAKAYEKHVEENGSPDNHAKAKELLAAFSAAAVTHVAETKGADAWDAYQQKRVQENAAEALGKSILSEYQ
ncbi:CipC1 protein [Phlebopus sp. FC_14]|nr:CipC1 protein [Phlebopus sp. FC_14]